MMGIASLEAVSRPAASYKVTGVRLYHTPQLACLNQLRDCQYLRKPGHNSVQIWVGRESEAASLLDVCRGLLLHVMAVLSGSTAVVMVFALLLIIQPRPWWSAQYLIAILGLLLGTALSCAGHRALLRH